MKILIALMLAVGSMIGATGAARAAIIQHVFVITMENEDSYAIYGDLTHAPYINNQLLPKYAHATNFQDVLPLNVPSEPHYLLMEAGTRQFVDHTFTNDAVPSAVNSTASTAHLVTQMEKAHPARSWITYQEDIAAGECPIGNIGQYKPKHNPFVFFQDVAGNPPSKTSARCIAHTRPYSQLATDLAANDIADYVFITPNLCNDMHGGPGCIGDNIANGDKWLRAQLPRLITWANKSAGVIFIVWDEGGTTRKIPFLAIGPGVRPGYTGPVLYTHGSLVKSIERIFGLPYLATVRSDNDFANLFLAGKFP